MTFRLRVLLTAACAQIAAAAWLPAEPRLLSGIYPSLAMYNDEGECGTGAVVPWADRLWVTTYAPHDPKGSSDKLYEITPDMRQIVRPESIGGTPANRMIHRESSQLFIGPYAIDAQRKVRVIPYTAMFGRPTGNARHLFDPAGKIYYATMEEGLYEVDVKTLAVTELWADEQVKTGRHSGLPGYHGKGFYSTQGRLIYANNGDHAPEALKDPAVPSGVLAEWNGKSDQWTVVRRNQFTEVTGPGGIYGNEHPDKDPVWSIGWDHRSLILQCLDNGKWHSWRLPKSSHSYDGAHGWNTEWPRIRDIGEDALLMTMHGAMWKFPRTFSASNSAGIVPRCNYLKVIGDFARWQNWIVFGCDDTAKNEFLNKRKAKGRIAAPQSQSNLWFKHPPQLDDIGPALGRGGVWVEEDVAANAASDAFLVSGFARGGLHLSAANGKDVAVRIEVDREGRGGWINARTVTLPANGYVWLDLSDLDSAIWARLIPEASLSKATAWFSMAADDRRRRDNLAVAVFNGVANAEEKELSGGLIRARGENTRTLSLAAVDSAGRDIGYYELDGDLNLKRIDDAKLHAYAKANTAIPAGVLTVNEASVLFVDDAGRRCRLPKGDPALDKDGPLGPSRVCREVATERDLFNAHGTFYELPAENAGGFAKVRPVATHNHRIHDYCSYRGLFLMTGIATDEHPSNSHIIRSNDGKAALWAGVIDDIWEFGKPRGHGGPWKNTKVKAGEASDPYLMTGYDEKTLTLSHDSAETVTMTLEVDVTGTGQWKQYQKFPVQPGKETAFEFPPAFSCYWVRLKSGSAARVSAQLLYK